MSGVHLERATPPWYPNAPSCALILTPRPFHPEHPQRTAVRVQSPLAIGTCSAAVSQSQTDIITDGTVILAWLKTSAPPTPQRSKQNAVRLRERQPPVQSAGLRCAICQTRAVRICYMNPLDARFCRMMVSLQESNTTRTFAVSSAHVTWENRDLSGSFICSVNLRLK